MPENLIIFPYAQYIMGIYVSLAFQKCTQFRGQCWGLRVICKNVTPFPMFWLPRSSKLLCEAFITLCCHGDNYRAHLICLQLEPWFAYASQAPHSQCPLIPMTSPRRRWHLSLSELGGSRFILRAATLTKVNRRCSASPSSESEIMHNVIHKTGST